MYASEDAGDCLARGRGGRVKALGYAATGAVPLFGLLEASLAVMAMLTMRIY